LFEGLVWIDLRKTLIYEEEYPDFGVRDWCRADLRLRIEDQSSAITDFLTIRVNSLNQTYRRF